MQIKSGELYENRTAKYLFPAIKHYGEELTNYLEYFFKLGIGLADNNKKLPPGCLYILLDANPTLYDKQKYSEKLNKFLNWIKYQNYYVDDYVFCLKEGCNSHMVVLDFPMEYNTAYSKFLLSRYSQMYTKEQINKIFPLDRTFNNKQTQEKYLKRIKHIRNILLKEDESDFIKQVNKDFGTNISKFGIKKELDYPFDYKEEVFNFKD